MKNVKSYLFMLFLVVSFFYSRNSIYASSYDETKPEVHTIRIQESEVLAPGYLNLELTDIVEEESGIVEIRVYMFPYDDYGTAENKYKIEAYKNLTTTPLYTGQSYIVQIPVSSTMKSGKYVITGLQLKDARGNFTAYYRDPSSNTSEDGTEYLTQMSGDDSILPCYIDGQVHIYSTSADLDLAISNPFITEKISEMPDGNIARIFVDGTGKTIVSKNIFDAIRGTTKKIIVQVSDGIEWYFDGRDIINDAKDIDCKIKISTSDAEIYGSDKKILQVNFAPNGILPGKALIRFKSDYIHNIYKMSDKLYLYYLEGNDLTLENNPKYILDGTDHWCEFEISHNSTFLISGTQLKDKIQTEKPTVTLNVNKITMQVKQKTTALKIKKQSKDDTVLKWSSSDTTVVSVDKKTGKLTAKKTGTATITLKMKSGVTAKCTVKVQKKPVNTTKLSLKESKLTLKKGKTYELNAARMPITANDKLTWKSSKPSIVKVDSKGKITALKKGTAVITVKSESGKKDTVKIVVK